MIRGVYLRTEVYCTSVRMLRPSCVCLLAGLGLAAAQGYTQAWLRGEGPAAHPHEGIRLADQSGWVTVGEHLPAELSLRAEKFTVMVRNVDNEANIRWTVELGDDGRSAHNAGYSIIQGADGVLYVGFGWWQHGGLLHNGMAPAVAALDPATGAVLWTKLLGEGQSGHGGVRSCIMDGEEIVCAGYVGNEESGFVFVADSGMPAVWRLSSQGELLSEVILQVEGMGQVAKIRKDLSSGFVACSTAWGRIGLMDIQVAALVKISNSFDIEWSQTFGLRGGMSQVFDMLVDYEGNYLLGGHTTVGEGVVNWDYLALKISSQGEELWRRTWGQPRGFDPRWIHDEMYSVGQDNQGNYLLLGGSGDEYAYSETHHTGPWAGWSSDTWGTFLVVADPATGDTVYQNFYGDKGGNNAGEWHTYDRETGDIMVYLDSDTVGGFGYLKLNHE